MDRTYNLNYARLDADGKLDWAPGIFYDDKGEMIDPSTYTDETFFSRGYKLYNEQRIDTTLEPGYDRLIDRYEVVGDYVIAIYEDKPNADFVRIQMAKYDNVLEEYLRAIRFDRGYTSREPDSYMNSSHPRWKQDAIDWSLFRDEVMEYGLSVINDYQQKGISVSIDTFKENLPLSDGIWTYQEQKN